jgi:hypothetical protein
LGDSSFWMPGENATLRGVKSRVCWAYPTLVVQDKPDLIALYMPAGVLGNDTDHKPTPLELLSPENINIVDCTWNRTNVLFLMVPGEPFSTYIMRDARTNALDCWYINLQEPIRRTETGFDTMDHMLDIVGSPDMSEWKWKDEDEFTEAERIGYFSNKEACEIRLDGEKAIRLLTSERRSFYEHWARWQANPAWKVPELSPLWDKIIFHGASL